MQRKEFEKKAETRDASKLKVGVVLSRFNSDITESMLEGALGVLREWGVSEKNVHVARVYGSFELPAAAQRLVLRHQLDALVAIGCIIKGETRHDAYLAQATFQGLMRVSLDSNVPIGLGVLTTNTLAQARTRSRGKTNHGEKAAEAALEAALL